MTASTHHPSGYRACRFKSRLPGAVNPRFEIVAHHWLAAALAIAAALTLGGCDYLPFGYTPIREITAAPGQFDGKEVRVKGQVRDPVQLLGLRAFVVADDTGEITVTTSASLPAAGTEAAVKGIVKSAIIVSGKSIGLRVEETQRLR